MRGPRLSCLEFASDMMVQRGQTHLQDLPDRVVQITQDEPNFWFGNRVIFRDPPKDAAALIAQFHHDVPDARHICLGWDIPQLSLAEVQAVCAGTGLIVQEGDTLTLPGTLTRAHMPEGVAFRPFTSDQDWSQSEAIAAVDLRLDGAPEAGMDAFLQSKTQARKAQIARGYGQWFGAFEGDQLLGDMGIFFDESLIRYQSVQTHTAHRRRGICSALLCHALDWARPRAPEALPMIVADAGSEAGRLYRRCGFVPTETTISAYRPPPD
ncbi:GNAT family N-acetyltransferase [Aliiroseovarius crassostreae]|uniref:GNAT family N-acetyltransferase n=1 Tax=Aliiroseovarius crassostreae TaxID=154981 RepID=UPI003C799806